MKRLSAILVTLFLIVSILHSEPAQACSGGVPTSLSDLLENASTVVKARVLDADTYGQTGVVEVIEYLVGTTGHNPLLVVQTNPVRTRFLLENRGGPGGCALLAPPLAPDEIVYLFLAYNSDGTYRPSVDPTQFSYRTMAYRFPQLNSTAVLFTGELGTASTPGTLEPQIVTETEFREIVLTHAQSTPSFPITSSPYPSPAPILLSTTAGYYLLPPDHSDPQRLSDQELASLRRSPSVWRRNDPLGVTGCNEIGCTAYSPSGMDQASLTHDGVMLNGMPVEGEGFLFSFTSELVAVWTQDTIDFYAFRYPRLGTEDFGNTLLASHRIRNGREWIAKAAWTQDGRLLAYTDVDGLWLIDVYSQSARLVLPAEGTDSPAFARYFSHGGRYLAITRGNQGERFNLDLITGELLPDGVLSPNERSLIAFDTLTRVSMYSQCMLTTPYPCREISLGREVFWLDAYQYIMSHCESSDSEACITAASSITCCSNLFFGETLAIDHEPVTGTFLVVRGHRQIDITDGYHTINHDLQNLIEGEIINVEWLPSLYYGERTFSDTVNQR